MSSNRRDFLCWSGLATLTAGCRHVTGKQPVVSVAEVKPGSVPRRPLGNTGVQVSILGMGGAHLGRVADLPEATRMVHEALDAGLNFFDNAWEYNGGRSEEWLGAALEGKRDRAFLMTKVCTHGRGRQVAMEQLHTSLRRLRTDHLDLWQIHECIYDNDPDLHFAADGVVHALAEAKQQGKVRFVGFTGHKDPRIHLRMLSGGFAFDTVQMPLNAFDANFRSFEREVVPVAAKAKLGVIGMKSMSGQGEPVRKGVLTAEEALSYAMSVPGVSTTVCGMDSLEILRRTLAVAAAFRPLSAAAMDSLRTRCAAFAGDGHFELYKTTTQLDASVGREQHGYPDAHSLPL